MAKLIILSILLVAVAIPASFSSAKHARKGLKQAQTYVVIFVVVWCFLCLHLYPELVQLK